MIVFLEITAFCCYSLLASNLDKVSICLQIIQVSSGFGGGYHQSTCRPSESFIYIRTECLLLSVTHLFYKQIPKRCHLSDLRNKDMNGFHIAGDDHQRRQTKDCWKPLTRHHLHWPVVCRAFQELYSRPLIDSRVCAVIWTWLHPSTKTGTTGTIRDKQYDTTIPKGEKHCTFRLLFTVIMNSLPNKCVLVSNLFMNRLVRNLYWM